jgi:hypothetical protein
MATTSVTVMSANGSTTRRGRTRTSNASTAKLPTSASVGSTSWRSRTCHVGTSRMASSCAMATPKMSRPISSAVSARHCMSAWAIVSNVPSARSHSTSPRQHSPLPTKSAGKR